MADVIQTNPNTKQDLIAAAVQRELKFKAKLMATVTDLSMFAGKGAKSVSFPKLSSFTAEDRALGTTNDAQGLTDSLDTLLLNHPLYVKWIIDSADEVQTTLAVQVENAKRAASAHARKVDNLIVDVLENEGDTDAGYVGDITRDIILDMREQLFDNEAEEDRMHLVVSNDQEKAMLKIAEFTRNDVYGPNNAIRSGQIGTVYGIPVIRRSGLAAQSFYMYDKEGVGIAFQQAPSMASQPDLDYGSSGVKYVMDQLMGVKGLQIGEANAAVGKSALIIKDSN